MRFHPFCFDYVEDAASRHITPNNLPCLVVERYKEPQDEDVMEEEGEEEGEERRIDHGDDDGMVIDFDDSTAAQAVVDDPPISSPVAVTTTKFLPPSATSTFMARYRGQTPTLEMLVDQIIFRLYNLNHFQKRLGDASTSTSVEIPPPFRQVIWAIYNQSRKNAAPLQTFKSSTITVDPIRQAAHAPTLVSSPPLTSSGSHNNSLAASQPRTIDTHLRIQKTNYELSETKPRALEVSFQESHSVETPQVVEAAPTQLAHLAAAAPLEEVAAHYEEPPTPVNDRYALEEAAVHYEELPTPIQVTDRSAVAPLEEEPLATAFRPRALSFHEHAKLTPIQCHQPPPTQTPLIKPAPQQHEQQHELVDVTRLDPITEETSASSSPQVLQVKQEQQPLAAETKSVKKHKKSKKKHRKKNKKSKRSKDAAALEPPTKSALKITTFLPTAANHEGGTIDYRVNPYRPSRASLDTPLTKTHPLLQSARKQAKEEAQQQPTVMLDDHVAPHMRPSRVSMEPPQQTHPLLKASARQTEQTPVRQAPSMAKPVTQLRTVSKRLRQDVDIDELLSNKRHQPSAPPPRRPIVLCSQAFSDEWGSELAQDTIQWHKTLLLDSAGIDLELNQKCAIKLLKASSFAGNEEDLKALLRKLVSQVLGKSCYDRLILLVYLDVPMSSNLANKMCFLHAAPQACVCKVSIVIAPTHKTVAAHIARFVAKCGSLKSKAAASVGVADQERAAFLRYVASSFTVSEALTLVANDSVQNILKTTQNQQLKAVHRVQLTE